MEKYYIQLTEEVPKYIQIYKHIKKLIDNNLVEDGEKLPSIRNLSCLLKVNNVTIVNAYKKLEQEGYAVQKVGSGTYGKRKEISKNYKKIYLEEMKKLSKEQEKNLIDFHGEGACGEFFPINNFKTILNEVLDRDGAEALVYQEALGYMGLRRTIDDFFWKGKKGENNIIIISGAQQGIDVVSKALINVNDNVLVEKPTYSGALSVFKGRRANIFEVPMESDGLSIEEIKKIVKKNKIKCLYTMSYFQNPTCISCSIEKKKELINMAEIYDFYIIEDDYLSELIYDDNMRYDSLKSLDIYDRVIYIKSFSKIFLPGIRLGYMIAPKELQDSIQNSKVNTDISTSSLMQRALELYISKGYWNDYMNSLSLAYKERYKLMKRLLQTFMGDKTSFISPGGGLNFYLSINNDININCMELFYECKNKGVLITPGIIFYKNYKEGVKDFRISFSQTNEEQMEKGLEVISYLLNDR